MAERNGTDPRAARTKKAIRNAFARLLSEKDLNDVTVREVAALAQINRKTFYNYYSGIYQVVEEIEDEIVREYEELLEGTDLRRDLRAPYVFFEKLSAVINSDMDFYGSLFSMSGNVRLTQKIVASLKEKTRRAMADRIGTDEVRADVAMQYVFSGMLAVYQQWFNSDRKRSVEEISAILGEVCFNGVIGLLDPAGEDRADGV